eukprot:545645_1
MIALIILSIFIAAVNGYDKAVLKTYSNEEGNSCTGKSSERSFLLGCLWSASDNAYEQVFCTASTITKRTYNTGVTECTGKDDDIEFWVKYIEGCGNGKMEHSVAWIPDTYYSYYQIECDAPTSTSDAPTTSCYWIILFIIYVIMYQ